MTRVPADLSWMTTSSTPFPSHKYVKDVLVVRELVMAVIVGVNLWQRTTRQKITLSLDMHYSTILGAQDHVSPSQDYRRLTDVIIRYLGR